jgi:TNF receptor-associated factor 4
MVLRELGIKGSNAIFFHSTKRDRVVFVEDVPPSLVCPVCNDALLDPLVAPCGHPVCAGCVSGVVAKTGMCFSCDDVVTPNDYVQDDLSAVKLGDLRCFCRHAIGLREVEATDAADENVRPSLEVYVRKDEFYETACSSSVPLRELEAHEAQCDFRPLMCDLRDETIRDELGAATTSALDEATNLVAPAKVCGFACLKRDMPFHQSSCDNRPTNCSFASFGCEWRGSFRRLAAHRVECRAQPRACPNARNGCRARVSVGPMTRKHLEVCEFGEVACDAPDAEADENDPNAPNDRCPAVVTRRDLAKHRKEHCEWARASKCRRCRLLVSLRSVSSHAEQRCSAAREPCPEGCGMVVGKNDLRAHLDGVCAFVVVDCPYKSLGCVARTKRGEVNDHLRDATSAHLELCHSGLLQARQRSVALGNDVDEHRKKFSSGLADARADALATVAAKESAALHRLATARERDEASRAKLASDAETLRRAMADQSETYSAQLLEIYDEIRELRIDFDAFRGKTEGELGKMRDIVENGKKEASKLFEEVANTREDAVGKYDEVVTRALEDEEHRWRTDVDLQTRALRAEFEDYKFGVNAKMRELWDAMRVAGRRLTT